MPRRRTLALSRETLAVLTSGDLEEVQGAAVPNTLDVKACLGVSVRVCFTDDYRTTCLNCE